jgi:RimJ/RimL family protein N-acetyltransferase
MQTARLNLRSWRTSDLEPLFEICSDEDVMRFVGSGAVWTRARCQEFIARNEQALSETGFCQWAVEVRETTELAGFCGLVPRGEDVEIGWRLGASHQRRGFAIEAALAVFGSHQAAGRKVFATVQSENLPSIRLAQRLGMERVDSFPQDGREMRLYRLILSAR